MASSRRIPRPVVEQVSFVSLDGRPVSVIRPAVIAAKISLDDPSVFLCRDPKTQALYKQVESVTLEDDPIVEPVTMDQAIALYHRLPCRMPATQAFAKETAR